MPSFPLNMGINFLNQHPLANRARANVARNANVLGLPINYKNNMFS